MGEPPISWVTKMLEGTVLNSDVCGTLCSPIGQEGFWRHDLLPAPYAAVGMNNPGKVADNFLKTWARAEEAMGPAKPDAGWTTVAEGVLFCDRAVPPV